MTRRYELQIARWENGDAKWMKQLLVSDLQCEEKATKLHRQSQRKPCLGESRKFGLWVSDCDVFGLAH
jgi:hypothetical protein